MKLVSWQGWAPLAAIFLVAQAVTLLSHFAVAVAPYPPDSSDQALYLAQSYDLAARGWHAIVSNVASAGAQGALFFSEGAALEYLFHLPRLSALLVNYGMLIAAETIIFATVRRVSQGAWPALAAVGIFLAAHTAWFYAGGLFDFRIDWLASCAYGIWCCTVLRSEVFGRKCWSVLTALTACFLILNRYVAGSYVFGVEAGLMIVFLLHGWRSRKFMRVGNLVIAMALQAVVIAPFLYSNRQAIHDYYVVGHLTGSENKIRAQEFGVNDLFDNLSYYPRSIIADHLGSPFLCLAVAFFVCAVGLGIAHRVSSSGTPVPTQGQVLRAFEAVFLLGAIAGPIVVLTTDLSKSPVVGGVVDVPIVLLITLLPRWLGWRREFVPTATLSRFAVAAGAAVALAGLVVEIDNAASGFPAVVRLNQQRWSLNAQTIVLDAASSEKADFIVSANSLSPHFLAEVFTDTAREMDHGDLHFIPGFAQSIYAPALEDYLEAFRRADYAILSDGPRAKFYPVSAFEADHDAEVRAIVQGRMEKLLELSYDGGTVETYRRRPELLEAWTAGSYGRESANGSPMQWLGSDSTLKLTHVSSPCVMLPLFGMGGVTQSVQIRGGASDQTVDLGEANVFRPDAVIISMPAGASEATFSFHALEPTRHFPEDGRPIAFGAGLASGVACPDRHASPG